MRPFPALLLAALLVLAPPARADPPDPGDFLLRLGILQGHLMIGHELLQAGHRELALPHFGHPVRELYDDLVPWIEARGIKPFDGDLIHLEADVARAPDAAATDVEYQAMLRTIARARATTPKALRDSIPAMVRLCAETLDVAAGEFGEAVNQGKITEVVEYHDSRGYLAWVAEELARLSALPDAAAQRSLIEGFGALLAKARDIVAPLIPGPTPRASVDDYRAIAGEAVRLAGP